MVNAIKCLFEVQKDNKQLLDEVFVICRIINVEVKVISRAEGEADNSYRDIDNSAQKPNPIIVLLYIVSGENKHGNERIDFSFQNLFKTRAISLFSSNFAVLQSPFPTNIHETLVERLYIFFCMCFWSLFPQAIDEFRLRRDATT